MIELDPREEQARDAREAGRYDESLDLLLQLFVENDAAERPSRETHFSTMFTWQLLAEQYAPARAALVAARDEQVRRMFSGDPQYGRDDREPGADFREWPWRPSRFSVAVEMNETLGDQRSTYEIFVRLDREQAEFARRHAAARALPAVVACGDFALADRYRAEPLEMLGEVNALARTAPLFPPGREAPRLATYLLNLMRDVRISLAVLEGTGRGAEAVALREQALAELASDELRALAVQELEQPDAIIRAIVARRMAEDGMERRAE